MMSKHELDIKLKDFHDRHLPHVRKSAYEPQIKNAAYVLIYTAIEYLSDHPEKFDLWSKYWLDDAFKMFRANMWFNFYDDLMSLLDVRNDRILEAGTDYDKALHEFSKLWKEL